MHEENSYQEVRRIREELARERAWNEAPEAIALQAFVANAFDLAYAAEAWAARIAESWIATNSSVVSTEQVSHLIDWLGAIGSAVGADLN